MKKSLATFTISLLLLLATGCTEESSTFSDEAVLSFSVDTLRFDTVFTSAGSVTQTLKIINNGNRSLPLEAIELVGGQTSPFRINIDGRSGPGTGPVQISANDSIYVFVTVTINPTLTTTPFLIADSIRVRQAGRSTYAQLRAYGQNANYLRGRRISTNTVWSSSLPYVIEGGLLVEEGATLTIKEGTRIHVNAAAPFIVDGTLVAHGTKKDSISFQGDRLDKDYRDLPGSWPGIYFRNSSRNNSLRNVYIKNAFQGIVTGKATGTLPNLTMEQCVIDNCYETGLVAAGSHVRLINTLISNCGINVLLTGGGNYDFIHCTFVSYSNLYIPHKKPVLIISNWDSTSQINSYSVKASLQNTIVWGEQGNIDDEIVLSKKGNAAFDLSIVNCLYKAKNVLSNAILSQNILNQPPLFDSVDERGRNYDFRLQKGRSPAIDKGKPLNILRDLDDLPRDSRPDIGCFEKQ